MGRLSRESIVDAAFELLAEGGLDAITARGLADRLGVRAGALYYHLPDMAALRDEMGTRITVRMLRDAPAATGLEARELLTAFARYSRSTLLEYRDGARLVSGTFLTDDSALRALETPLVALAASGFSALDGQRALSTMNAFVTGFVIEEQHRRSGRAADARYTAEQRRARLDPDEHPLSWAVSEEVVTLPEEAFEWGVAALVDGILARAGR